MRAVILSFCFLVVAVAGGLTPQPQRLAVPRAGGANTADHSYLNAQKQLVSWLNAAQQRQGSAALASYFSEYLTACAFSDQQVQCFSGADAWGKAVAGSINTTSVILAAADSVFPIAADPQAFAAMRFLDAGVLKDSLRSFSLPTFAVAQVDEYNKIDRYFEFNDMSATQKNATSMKQVVSTFYDYSCNAALSQALTLFTEDCYVVSIDNTERAFVTNRTELASAWKTDFFGIRVPNSCTTNVEHIGVAGDYVFVQRNAAFQLNLGNSTQANIQRGIDYFRLTAGTNGTLVIAEWYFYGHRVYN